MQMGCRIVVWGELERTSGPPVWLRWGAAADEGAKCGLLWDMRKQSLLQNSGCGRCPGSLTLSPALLVGATWAAHRTTLATRGVAVSLQPCAHRGLPLPDQKDIEQLGRHSVQKMGSFVSTLLATGNTFISTLVKSQIQG